MKSSFFRARRVLVAGVTGLLAMGFGAVIGTPPASAIATVSGFYISPEPAPNVAVGATGAASNLVFTLTNTFAHNNTFVLTISPTGGGGANDCATSDSVVFSALPTVTAVGGPTNSAGDSSITITPTLSRNAGDTSCPAGTNDVLTLTMPAPNDNTATDVFTVTISGISYTAGSSAGTGPVVVTASGSFGTPGVPSNATIVTNGATASGNNPVVDVTNGTNGNSISNVVVTESTAGTVNTDLCVTPVAGGTDVFTFSAATGSSAAPSTSGAGSIATPSISAGQIRAVVTPSTTAATTYTINGIQVNDGTGTGPAYALVTTGTNAGCGANTVYIATIPVFDSAPAINSSIFGADADATAITEMQSAYGSNGCPDNLPGSTGSVILATDQGFADALSASYLAGFMHTGILLTPTASLSAETQSALQTEGITDVYVVGGTFAVSQNVLNQLAALPAYQCGGITKTGANINVHTPIAGPTEYDTSELIATTPPAGNVHTVNLSGAYTNAYNSSPGNESAAPAAPGALKTAIVANGVTFQDASSASVLAYQSQFPLVLTDPSALSPQASNALTSLGIQQVIVLGGSLAVSNADVTAIQGLGMSVIRIAGQDGTDTAQELASFELNHGTPLFEGLGWAAGGSNTILLTRGNGFTDALAGSVLANSFPDTPLLSTEDPSTIGPYLAAFLGLGGSSNGIDNLNQPGDTDLGNIQDIQPIGGVLALTVPTLNAAAADVAAG